VTWFPERRSGTAKSALLGETVVLYRHHVATCPANGDGSHSDRRIDSRIGPEIKSRRLRSTSAWVAGSLVKEQAVDSCGPAARPEKVEVNLRSGREVAVPRRPNLVRIPSPSTIRIGFI
jgi:hypothetical protein